MNSTMNLQNAHASVRSFTPQSIDPELLHEILRGGQSAASSSFIQAYSIVRVTSPGKRATIAKAAGNQQWVIDAPEFLLFCADLSRVERGCISAGLGALEGYTEHFIAATVDVALVAQNVLLAAESAGLGGVYIGGVRNNPELVSECLELPELVYPVFGMCLGWPADKPGVKPRLPLQTILHQDKYRMPTEQEFDDYNATMRDYYAHRGSNVRNSDWSEQTATAVQGKKREHMLGFLRARRFLLR